MGRLPKGWKKAAENESVIAYSKKNYIIHIWKYKKPKRFVVEPFRKLANYKRRLFSKEFRTLSAAKKFAWNLMKQKEIRGYYLKGND
ncbi:MAG: hypothetical protein J7K73_00255 [Nanoarchaeota archaeon]|nr:hypothetical protein [Nanoarchaeota archaeon]